MGEGGDVCFVENGEGFLGFAKGVAEEDGLVAIIEGGLHELQDVVDDFFAGRKYELGAAEGGFHDEDVGWRSSVFSLVRESRSL